MSEYTEVEHQGWFSRITESIKSVLIGIVLFLVSFPLLIWNEGRAVKTAKGLEEGAKAAITVSADKVDSSNEKKLVHMCGKAVTEETVKDPKFGISAKAIALKRTVKMYQWDEDVSSRTKKKVGGGTKTVKTYSYKQVWSEKHLDSSSYKKSGHDNPSSMPFESKTFHSPDVTVGAFRLSPDLVDQIDKFESLMVSSDDIAEVNDTLQAEWNTHGGGFYRGKNPSSPAIGDVKINFQVVKPCDVSLYARQLGNTFEPYPTKVGRQLADLRLGTLSAEAMFEAAKSENAMLTWILRGVGFLLMLIGLCMIFSPLVVVADVIPFVGNILGAGVFVFSLVISLFLSLTVIAIAWIVFRPLLGALLLAGAGAAIAGGIMIGKSSK